VQQQGRPSKLCHELGRVGSYRPCGIERRPLMIAVAVAGVLALLLNVYALFSLSTDAKVIKPTAWAVGNTRAGFPTGTAYFGLTTAVGFHGGDKIFEDHWAHVDCHAYSLTPNRANQTKPHGDVDRCKRCKSDVGQMATTVIVSAIATLGTLRYAHRRANPETDRNFFKAMGIVVGLIAFSTALGPMLAFQKHCTRSNTDMLKMRAGPSYICMGFAVFLKSTTVVAHLALRQQRSSLSVRCKHLDADPPSQLNAL